MFSLFQFLKLACIAASLSLALTSLAAAQQVIVVDLHGPNATLGVPRNITVPNTGQVPNATSNIKNPDSTAATKPTRPSYPIIGQPLNRPLVVKNHFVSDGPSLAELALPPELVGTQPPGTNQAEELPPPKQAGPAPTVEELLPNAATPRTTESIKPPAPQFDPLDALPPEFRQQAPAAAPQAPATAPHAPATAPHAPLGGQTQGDPTNGSGRGALSQGSPAGEAKQPMGPYFYSDGSHYEPCTDTNARPVPYAPSAFLPPPMHPVQTPLCLEATPYRNKHAVPTQRPWVELGRPLYTGGIYPPAKTWFGAYNLVMPHFMVYGDYRTGIGINRNAAGDTNNWASRLNLEMDLEITATERLHAFMGPLDRNGDFTRLDFTNRADFINRTDMRLDNLFFEGDVGAILGGMNDQNSPFDLPFSFGFLPVFYQNGIWAADNVIGAAFALPAKNSPLLKWSNYDATFFWASDQINTDAFAGDNNAAEFFGTAWFIEAYDGYIEADYAFVHDDVGGHRSYHNLSVAYTRRYFYRLSNSIRYITNFGQSLPSDQRTADGHLILIENSLISAAPNTFVPYLNFFYGQGRTQSLARAGGAGGILNNTGINFETDGLTGYPTLDATGVNATGAALGVNILGANFSHQLILELAALSANGAPQFRNAPGDQYAAGLRYQKPINNAWIFRTDHMYGWRDNAADLRGSRVELRWKF